MADFEDKYFDDGGQNFDEKYFDDSSLKKKEPTNGTSDVLNLNENQPTSNFQFNSELVKTNEQPISDQQGLKLSSSRAKYEKDKKAIYENPFDNTSEETTYTPTNLMKDMRDVEQKTPSFDFKEKLKPVILDDKHFNDIANNPDKTPEEFKAQVEYAIKKTKEHEYQIQDLNEKRLKAANEGNFEDVQKYTAELETTPISNAVVFNEEGQPGTVSGIPTLKDISPDIPRQPLNSFTWMTGQSFNDSATGLASAIYSKDYAVDKEYLDSYDPNWLEEVGAFGLSMLWDAPLLGIGGKVASLGIKPIAVKAIERYTEKLISSGIQKQVAEQIAKNSIEKFSKKITQMATSGSAFGTYGFTKDVLNQWADPNTTFSDIKFSESLKTGAKDFLLGTAIGGLNVLDDVILGKVASNTSGVSNAMTRLGVKSASFGAENAIFLYGGKALEGESFDSVTAKDWASSMLLIGGMKAVGGKPKMSENFNGNVNKGIYKVELTPHETKLIGTEDVTEFTNNSKLKEVLSNKDIPQLTKAKILWATNGIMVEGDYKAYTVESEGNVVKLYNKNGDLNAAIEYGSEAEAKSKVLEYQYNIDDRVNKEKLTSLSTSGKSKIMYTLKYKGVSFNDLYDALNRDPKDRSPEDNKLINEIYSEVNKYEKPAEEQVENIAKQEEVTVPSQENITIKIDEVLPKATDMTMSSFASPSGQEYEVPIGRHNDSAKKVFSEENMPENPKVEIEKSGFLKFSPKAVDFTVKPTEEQFNLIKSKAEKSQGDYEVTINGEKQINAIYEKGTPPEQIVLDLKNYYETGEVKDNWIVIDPKKTNEIKDEISNVDWGRFLENTREYDPIPDLTPKERQEIIDKLKEYETEQQPTGGNRPNDKQISNEAGNKESPEGATNGGTEGGEIGGTTRTGEAGEPVVKENTPKEEPLSSVIDKDRLSGIKKDLYEGGQADYEKRTISEWMDISGERVESGVSRPKELVDALNIKPRALDPIEVSDLIYYKAKLDNKFDSLTEEVKKHKESGDIEAELESKLYLDATISELNNYKQMVYNTAYVQGLAFRLRQALLDSDMNLRDQIQKYKAINKGEIPPEVEAKFKEYDAELSKLNKELKDLQAQKEYIEWDKAAKQIRKNIRLSKSDTGKTGKDLMAEGFQELAQALGGIKMAEGGVNPKATEALAKIGRGLIQDGLATLDNVIQKIKEAVGDKFKIKVEDYEYDIIESIKESSRKPFIKKGVLKVPDRIISEYVKEGITDINDLTLKIKESIKDELPNITERQVRDAITSYGKEVTMSKDNVKAKINELKRFGRLISKLEDIKTKKPLPIKQLETKRTDTEKELIEQIKQASIDLGLTPSKMDIPEPKTIGGMKDVRTPEQKRLDRLKKDSQKSIYNYEQRIKGIKDGDYSPVLKKETIELDLLDSKAIELLKQKHKLRYNYEVEFEKARLKNRGIFEFYTDMVVDVLNLPKSMLSGLDLSSILRQGVILTVNNPTAVPYALKGMFKDMFNEKYAKDFMETLKASDEYFFMNNQAKLFLSEPASKVAAKEDNFIANLAHKIPIYGDPLSILKGKYKIPGLRLPAISERAFSGYLNRMRVHAFAKGADYLYRAGYSKSRDVEVYKAWADFINNASGRGGLGKLERSVGILNATMFSPRLVASRFNLLNPVKYAKMPPEVRKMALKNMATYIGVGVTFLLLAKQAGAEVEGDPRSSDFGKVKVGDIRFDIWAGFQPLVRSIAQFATNERKSTKTGEIKELEAKKFPFSSRATVVGSFFRNKFSPAATIATDWMFGQTSMGEDFEWGELPGKEFVPLYLQDMKEIIDNEGVGMAAASSVPSIFGIGTQYYKPKEKKSVY